MVTLETLKIWVSGLFLLYGVYWILPFKVRISYKPWMESRIKPRELTEEQRLFIKYLVSKARWLREYWVLIQCTLITVAVIVFSALYYPSYGEYVFFSFIGLLLVAYVVDDDYRRWVRKNKGNNEK